MRISIFVPILLMFLVYFRFFDGVGYVIKAMRFAFSIEVRKDILSGIVAVLLVAGCAWHAHEEYDLSARSADAIYRVAVISGGGAEVVSPGREYPLEDRLDFIDRCSAEFGSTVGAGDHCLALLSYVENALTSEEYESLIAPLQSAGDDKTIPSPVQAAMSKFFL